MSTIMLAETPWTFPFWLGWTLLALVSPLVLGVVLVLSGLRATRRVGLRLLFFGLVGALFGCIADAALAVWAHEPLSQSTAMGWLVAVAGGFSLFAVSAGAIASNSLRKKV